MLHSINWADPKSRISEHFTVHEATFLPSWGVHHPASDAERAALQRTCVMMEKARIILGNRGITAHCFIRPNKYLGPAPQPQDIQWSPDKATKIKQAVALAKGDYNAFIGSTAQHSPHIMGLACDFSVAGLSCDEARKILEPRLEELGVRMERLPAGSTWVHLDLYSPSVSGGVRYFQP